VHAELEVLAELVVELLVLLAVLGDLLHHARGGCSLKLQ